MSEHHHNHGHACCGGGGEKKPEPKTSCCDTDHKCPDYVLWGSFAVIAAGITAYLLDLPVQGAFHFGHAALEMLGDMWWGVALGVFFIGLMSRIPQDYFSAVLGDGKSTSGLFKAAAAGVLLDLCSHGILMIGAKMYQRGVSLPQVMTFLIASPWNSFSLTLVLIGLVGLKWTLAFIAGSLVIAILSGLIFQMLIARGILPDNPNTAPASADFDWRADMARHMRQFRPDIRFLIDVVWQGIKDSRMIVRWLLLGVVIAAATRAFIPEDIFAQWLGPSLVGLVVTLVAATIIEVCSEGAAPIASEILNRAGAPGNAFTFLMAGVATDYTEMMVLREVTGSWKIPLFLPLVTVPQTLLLALVMNMAAG